jgi:hypothetical protein
MVEIYSSKLQLIEILIKQVYSVHLVERDFYTGLVDLIGNSVVGQGQTAFDFYHIKRLFKKQLLLQILHLIYLLTLPLYLVVFSYIGQGVHWLQHSY